VRQVLALVLMPVMACAGTRYDVSTRPIEPLANADVSAPPAPIATPYFVQDGSVRIGGASAKTVYLFKDRTAYVIDNPSHTVSVLKHATLAQVTAHYDEVLKQLEDAAAAATPDKRTEAERLAADMKRVSERLREPVLREYRVTVRFETVDGHSCRIWEERERDAKRLEVCMAPVATVTGGVDILAGMKELSQFQHGSNFAFGVDFGLAEWWSDIARLGGVPLLVREFKYDLPVSEVTLTAMHQGGPVELSFDMPPGYRMQDGPDYSQWYAR
jgi:hypothetical protein